MVARGRWARLVCLLVCRHTSLVCSKLPRGLAGYGPSARDRPLPVSGRQKSKSSPVCSIGTSAICPTGKPTGPRGEREALCRRRLPRGPRSKKLLCCEYSKGWSGKPGPPSVRVQTARLRSGSRDCRAVKLLSTQIVRKQAKALFISNNAAHCMQRHRQCFPTVRTVGEVGNGEARAKTRVIRACASTAT
jgi:hypothetical protein